MRRSGKHAWLVVYCLVYALIYAGWWFHRCRYPVLFHYSLKYMAFLGAMTLGFLVPSVVRVLEYTIGRKRFRYSVATTLIMLAGVYFAASVYYYYSRRHAFDPFVQVPPARFESERLQNGNDTFRILALGGSTTRCPALDPAHRYPRVLDKMLRTRYPSTGVDVLNGASEWYTTRHSLINYVTYYRDLEPDVVLIMHGINDLCRSFSPPDFAMGEYDPLWSHYYGPSIRGAKPPTFEAFILRRHLANVLDAWYSTLRFGERAYPIDRYVSLGMFEKNLRRLVRSVRADGAVVVLITQPSLYKDAMSQEEKAVLQFGRVFCNGRTGFAKREFPTARSLGLAMMACADLVRQIAAKEGAILVDADRVMPKDLDHFRDDVHYTEQGAQALAEMVAETLIESGIVKQGVDDR